jgi:hypothetical protein
MRSCSLGRLRIAADVSRSDEQPYVVAGDRPRLLQLLLNLLLSFEGLLSGRQGATIGIRLERRSSMLAVVAQATGDGPAPSSDSGVSRLIADREPGGPLWAAARLAVAQAGTLVVEERDGVAVATFEMKSERS